MRSPDLLRTTVYADALTDVTIKYETAKNQIRKGEGDMTDAILWILRRTLTVSFMALFGSSAFAASQQDYDNCSQTQDLQLAIATCTRIADDQSESTEDRISAMLQVGNAFVSLNDLRKAFAIYSAANELADKKKFQGPLDDQIQVDLAIVSWRLYQADHDDSYRGLAILEFNAARGFSGTERAKSFDALVATNSTLQEIKRAVEGSEQK